MNKNGDRKTTLQQRDCVSHKNLPISSEYIKYAH